MCISWSSNTIKRVCRSTLQAETLSLQLGSEECEHLRQCFYYMKNLSSGGIPSKDYVKAHGLSVVDRLSQSIRSPDDCRNARGE